MLIDVERERIQASCGNLMIMGSGELIAALMPPT